MTGFYLFTILAAVTVVFSLGWLIFCKGVKRFPERMWWNKTLYILSGGVLFAGAFLYGAYYLLLQSGAEGIEGVPVAIWESLGTIAHDVYQLFSADSDYTGIFKDMEAALVYLTESPELTGTAGFFFCVFRAVYTLLYASAPILTLTVVLVFFKSFVSGIRYRCNFRSDIYVFSELNDRSLALATSIASRGGDAVEEQYQDSKKTLDEDFELRYERTLKEIEGEYATYQKQLSREALLAKAKGVEPDFSKYPLPKPRTIYRAHLVEPAKRSLLVFLGVEETNDEEILLAEKAREIGALIFRTGVLSTNLFKKKRNMNFFLIGEDETENVGTAIGLLEKYATRDNTNVYVFSDSPESELLLKSAGDETRAKAIKTMSERRRKRFEQEAKEAKAREEARLAKQKADIAADPTNFPLYITEAESDYRSGALVKRVNIIRSLIYHTFYNYEFLKDRKEEREKEAQAFAESRVARVKEAMAPLFLENGITDEEKKTSFAKLTADFITSHGDYAAEYQKKLLDELAAYVKDNAEENELILTVHQELLNKYLGGQKKLKKKDRVSLGTVFADILIEREESTDEAYHIDAETKKLLTAFFLPFIKDHPFCLDEQKEEYRYVLENYLKVLAEKDLLDGVIASLSLDGVKLFGRMLTPYLLVYPFWEGESETAYDKLCKLSVSLVEEEGKLAQKTERERLTVRNIFESAVTVKNEDGSEKKVISAVVIGMGLHGTEMLKGLVWYGQMDGYELHINAFDRDPGARSRFAAQCPELMDPAYNGNPDSEDCYHIDIHTADIDSEEFVEKLKSLPTLTYVAVCLGDDEKNLEMAVRMRSLCKKMGAYPFIQAIRYNLGENEDFSQARNYKGQTYDIDLIGDMKSLYSVSAIIRTKYEHEALSRHMKWGGEKSFWEFEYNYNSSIASAIHSKAKKKLDIPGTEVDSETRKVKYEKNFDVIDRLRRLEHRRWNAYMRTEGYSFGKKRDDLAKLHHCLVPFDELDEYERTKDDD